VGTGDGGANDARVESLSECLQARLVKRHQCLKLARCQVERFAQTSRRRIGIEAPAKLAISYQSSKSPFHRSLAHSYPSSVGPSPLLISQDISPGPPVNELPTDDRDPGSVKSKVRSGPSEAR
jgi:hypothetical protein